MDFPSVLVPRHIRPAPSEQSIQPSMRGLSRNRTVRVSEQKKPTLIKKAVKKGENTMINRLQTFFEVPLRGKVKR
jgi:hypothetical protein